MNDERALSMHKECLDGDRVFVIDDFLTPAQCRSFLEQSERRIVVARRYACGK